ncbi:MAG TPA: hypothetical protein VLW85_09785 [Myxococcales bacterium]|nr:hypothetical protein [Myxococcales bacterium]
MADPFRESAAAMAQLDPKDPERAAFLEHARTCAECMAAFREGEKLAALLSGVQLPAPSAAALERARAAVTAEMQPKRRLSWLPALAAVAAFVVPVLFARHLDSEGWTAALVAVGAATILALNAGTVKAGALVGLFASAGFAFAAGGVPGFPRAGAGLVTGVGVHCLLTELGVAALPLVAAAWQARRSAGPGALAQAAAAGALAGQAALHLSCPAHAQAPHLWMFHVGGVGLAALIGWLLDGRFSATGSGSAASA